MTLNTLAPQANADRPDAHDEWALTVYHASRLASTQALAEGAPDGLPLRLLAAQTLVAESKQTVRKIRGTSSAAGMSRSVSERSTENREISLSERPYERRNEFSHGLRDFYTANRCP